MMKEEMMAIGACKRWFYRIDRLKGSNGECYYSILDGGEKIYVLFTNFVNCGSCFLGL